MTPHPSQFWRAMTVAGSENGEDVGSCSCRITVESISKGEIGSLSKSKAYCMSIGAMWSQWLISLRPTSNVYDFVYSASSHQSGILRGLGSLPHPVLIQTQSSSKYSAVIIPNVCLMAVSCQPHSSTHENPPARGSRDDPSSNYDIIISRCGLQGTTRWQLTSTNPHRVASPV